MSVEKSKELKATLKKYLGQYYRAKIKQKQLEIRLKNFREEMAGPQGLKYSPIPGGQSGSQVSSTENAVMRVMEFEERIAKQQAQVQKSMLAVVEFMDFLPIDSVERSVLEYRHIDCMSWKQICKEMCMTKTPCFRYYNKGIDELINKNEAVQILKQCI